MRTQPGAGGGAERSPAAVVVPAHEHLAPSTADGAIGLVPVVVVLVCALQEAVLGRMGRVRSTSAGVGQQSQGKTGSDPDSKVEKGTAYP